MRFLHRHLGLLLLPLLPVLALGAPPAPAPAPVPTAPELLALSRPLVIAHRGWSGIAPENTLPAFQLALDAEADLVELDYHHTADGVPVVLHDPTLKRTTDAAARWPGGDLAASARPLEELRALDAGAWFHPRFAGTAVPTLAESLDLIQPRSVTLIERKAGDAATLAALLRQRGLINRVVVQSFDWNYLRALHAELPDQVLGALGPRGRADGQPLTPEEKILGPAHLDEIAALGARLAVWSRDVTRDSVTAAHARGLKVFVYTIDDPALARSLLALGVDGIITNQPARLWRTMASPAPTP